MQAPQIAPGTVEQAIFTWSKINLDGGKGQGFGGVSAGLTDSLTWLQAIEPRHWQIKDASLSEGEPYADWRQFVAVGSLRSGGLSLVYRKIASAGVDGAHRNRSVVHILVGRADELDLAAVSDDDPHWLTAADCPLDTLPPLEVLEVNALCPRSLRHSCVTVDPVVEGLRNSLEDGMLVIDQPGRAHPPELIGDLLIAVPTALWQNIELGWYVGPQGPIARIRLRAHNSLPIKIHDRVRIADLADCALHRAADERWAQLPSQSRTWAGLVKALRNRPVATSGASSARSATSAPLGGVHLTLASRASSAIASAIGTSSWDQSRVLTDREAGMALDAIERLPVPPSGWIRTLSIDEWRAILTEVETSAMFERVTRFFDTAGASTDDLVFAWKGSGTAAVGLALLSRDPGRDLHTRWAVPREVDAANLQKLVQQLVKTEEGVNRLSQLFHGGFAAAPGDRRRLVAAVTEAGVTPRGLFGTILLDAELPPAAVLEIMRENIDGVSRWLKLPAVYTEALRLGLTRRRRFSLSALRLTGGEHDGAGGL